MLERKKAWKDPLHRPSTLGTQDSRPIVAFFGYEMSAFVIQDPAYSQAQADSLYLTCVEVPTMMSRPVLRVSLWVMRVTPEPTDMAPVFNAYQV